MRSTLKVVAEGDEVVVPAERPFVVGRGQAADIILSDNQVSRRHLLIESTDDGWTVRDVSSGGTWLAGRRVRNVDVHDEIHLHLGTPLGPEVTLSLEAPPDPDATVYPDPSATAPHSELVTLRRDSPGFRPTGPRLPPADRRRADADAGGGAGAGGAAYEHRYRNVHRLSPGVVSIGRSQSNDIVVGDLLASRIHAELLLGQSGIELVDLGSANGTFLNGQRISRAIISERAIFAVGHHIFQLVGNELFEYIDSGDVTFEADGLSVDADGQKILHDVSFRLPGRAMLAVIGPSGAGKSTLLDALTGFRPADTGAVRYAGRDMYAEYDELRRRIGYVPQSDILHVSLTVRQALEYGAELRFPADTTKAERAARVDAVLAELGLTTKDDAATRPRSSASDSGTENGGGGGDGDGGGSGGGNGGGGGGSGGGDAPRTTADLAGRRVEKLSGGQRKRTSVALELLAEPTLLYLDEPTSGLDPGLDQEVMGSLRTLAEGGRTVIVVTHNVAQLNLCDYVLVLADGRTAYFGPPREALPFFEADDWAEVFRVLQTPDGAQVFTSRFQESQYFVAASVVAPPARPVPAELPSIRQQSVLAQMATSSRRSLSVIASDKSYLRLVIAFPILLGIVPRVVPAPNGLDPIAGLPNRDAILVLLVIVVCACFMGTANSIREIVKERAIYRRERAIGLSLTAYVGSKVGVLALVTTLQCIVFTTIGIAGRTPSGAAFISPLADILIAIAAAAFSSAMIGLMISALVDHPDKTMPPLVLVTMAQLVLTGGLMPVEGRAVLEQLSYLAPARWGFAAVAAVTDLNNVQKLGDPLLNPGSVADPLWEHSTSTYLFCVGACVAVGVAGIFFTALLLRRLDPKVIRRAGAARGPAGR